MKEDKDKYNPYKDPTIQIVEYSDMDELDQDGGREAFNDVIRHYDTVNGFRSPKTIDHFPKPLRGFTRWAIRISVLLLFFSVLSTCVSNLKSSF